MCVGYILAFPLSNHPGILIVYSILLILELFFQLNFKSHSTSECDSRDHPVSDVVVVFVINFFSHIRPLGATGALAVDICICFHDIKSYIFAKLFPSLAV